tara:strand:+ start:5107 stop:5754 length:648 start_codon:yes stop_codon:yes gene_type:complete
MSLVIFDLDDTLLAGDSETAWANFMVKNGIVKEKGFVSQLEIFEKAYREGKLDINLYIKFLLNPIKGMSFLEVKSLSELFAKEIFNDFTDRLTNELISRHSEDQCIIVSGTLDFIVHEISNLLGIEESLSTSAELKNGIFTGEIKGLPNFGKEKVKSIKEWLNNNSTIDDIEVFAYSDSIYDLPLLEYADKPFAVSPDYGLRKIALEKGWEIIDR